MSMITPFGGCWGCWGVLLLVWVVRYCLKNVWWRCSFPSSVKNSLILCEVRLTCLWWRWMALPWCQVLACVMAFVWQSR